jgi:hypothetical protein
MYCPTFWKYEPGFDQVICNLAVRRLLKFLRQEESHSLLLLGVYLALEWVTRIICLQKNLAGTLLAAEVWDLMFR